MTTGYEPIEIVCENGRRRVAGKDVADTVVGLRARVAELEALHPGEWELKGSLDAMRLADRYRAALEQIRDTDPNLSHAVAAVHMQAIATNALVNP